MNKTFLDNHNIKSKRAISTIVASATLAIFASLVLAVNTTSAATTEVTWTGGGGDNKFSTAANWKDGETPKDGDIIKFTYVDGQGDDINGDAYKLDNDLGVKLGGIENSTVKTGDWGFSQYCIDGDITFSDDSLVSGFGPRQPLATGYESGLMFGVCDPDSQSITFEGDATLGISLFGALHSAPNSTISVNSSVNSDGSGGIMTVSDGSDLKGDINVGSDSGVMLDGGYVHGITVNDGGGVMVKSSNTTEVKKLYLNGGELRFGTTLGGNMRVVNDVTNIEFSNHIQVDKDSYVSVAPNVSVSIDKDLIDYGGNKLTLRDVSLGQIDSSVVTDSNSSTPSKADEDLGNKNENILSGQTMTLTGKRNYVSVGAGGILKGTGFAAYIFVYNGGIVAPGMSPGVLHTNSLQMSNGSTYEVQIENSKSYDKIVVDKDGDVLHPLYIDDNALLDVSQYGKFNVNKGDVFTIVDVEDSRNNIDGTFKDLPEGAKVTVGEVTFQISYKGGDGNDITLTALNGGSNSGSVTKVPGVPDTGSFLKTSNSLFVIVSSVMAVAVLAGLRKYILSRNSR